jgi:hypothetical protein
MPRGAAGGAGGGAEFGAGLAGVGGLEDFAAGARTLLVGRGLARAAGAVGQGFRAVHFVEMGFVDAGGAGTARGLHPTPRACSARPSPSRGG